MSKKEEVTKDKLVEREVNRLTRLYSDIEKIED